MLTLLNGKWYLTVFLQILNGILVWVYSEATEGLACCFWIISALLWLCALPLAIVILECESLPQSKVSWTLQQVLIKKRDVNRDARNLVVAHIILFPGTGWSYISNNSALSSWVVLPKYTDSHVYWLAFLGYSVHWNPSVNMSVSGDSRLSVAFVLNCLTMFLDSHDLLVIDLMAVNINLLKLHTSLT